MSTTRRVDMSVTPGWSHPDMTAEQPSLPSQATVVDVHGSRFLLEWLDVQVLAAAAALRQPEVERRTA
jgi:hypothetical protein